MADLTTDPFISTEPEIEVDKETVARIESGIRDADEGRVVSSEEIRKRIPEWISKYSTQSRP
jgi:predicted transcriptional regulator